MSDEDEYENGTTMMHVVIQDVQIAEEHFLNFKGPIKAHRAMNQIRARKHTMRMDDYFVPDALFEAYFHRRFEMKRTVFDRVYNSFQAYDD